MNKQEYEVLRVERDQLITLSKMNLIHTHREQLDKKLKEIREKLKNAHREQHAANAK
jgi:hypothetical protein